MALPPDGDVDAWMKLILDEYFPDEKYNALPDRLKSVITYPKALDVIRQTITFEGLEGAELPEVFKVDVTGLSRPNRLKLGAFSKSDRCAINDKTRIVICDTIYGKYNSLITDVLGVNPYRPNTASQRYKNLIPELITKYKNKVNRRKILVR